MTGLIIVWASLPDEVLEWYEEEYIPLMRKRNAISTVHCELTESGFGGDPIGQLDAPWPLCAVYECPDIKAATASTYDKANHPSEEMLTGPLAKARFDVRTYRTLKKWKDEDWDEDPQDIGCVILMEWQIPDDIHDEVMDWYLKDVAPLLVSAPECLRLRLCEVDNATVLEGTSYETMEKTKLHNYLSVMEIDNHEWPWVEVMQLAEQENWKKYFEGRLVKFQIGSYIVKRLYEDEEKTAAREEQ